VKLLTVSFAALTLFILVAGARATTKHGRVPTNVDRAIHHASSVYGAPYAEMVRVSWCESRWNPNAVGDGSHGLFQFLKGTWANTPYHAKYIYSPWWNALAAAWLWRHDGGSWSEWTCQP
jgi:soluble lytic murein transglycosylase-like protein